MVDTSNYAKFQTRNPVVRWMIRGFYSKLATIIKTLGPETVLDAGCGEGETIARLGPLLPQRVTAVDIREDSLAFARRRLPSVDVSRQSVYALDFPDRSFDLVLCLEVLEHLDRPADALRELRRVCRRDLVVSVPYEPYFRLGTLLRGMHLRALGTHPEHVNAWSPRSFCVFLEPEVEPASLSVAFPWLIAHCRPAAGPARADRLAAGGSEEGVTTAGPPSGARPDRTPAAG